uniref:Uncharacterized protein n=1 Tax=Phytophthora fragariae TaxID=53985 RepID=A0A6A3DCA0_9STRA|nr:hypothetical protein PF009_g31818 [Phytophthora fragariae]
MLVNIAFASEFSGTGSSAGSVFALLYFGAKEDTPKLQGNLAGKMSVYDVVELLLSCDEMVGSAAGILDETKNAMREDPCQAGHEDGGGQSATD